MVTSYSVVREGREIASCTSREAAEACARLLGGDIVAGSKTRPPAKLDWITGLPMGGGMARAI